MFAALRSKSRDRFSTADGHHDGSESLPVGMSRTASSKRRSSKGHTHTVEQLQRRIATADEEIKHFLKCRSKCSAVHAIKKKQMYEKELAELLALNENNKNHKDGDTDGEQQAQQEYVRMMSVESPSIEYVDDRKGSLARRN
mmetsp:Transcript_24288/g.44588  ORF Transcript_24288/g.44588 Transcript_24288/m.44588 type:complete len:142 (+) Transcript_24288:74-499(+)